MIERARLEAAHATAVARLLAQRTPAGHWRGELSASALSTATACAALSILSVRRDLVASGMRWLADHQNADGGWGDTVRSFSNISTTMLVRAALRLTEREALDTTKRAERWLDANAGPNRAEAIRRRYGKDHTFAVPILTMSAIAELVPWEEVPRLPFEAAALPQSWYRFARMPVVSYALPALIAIGQCVEHHRGSWNPLRKLAKSRTLNVLAAIQPESGGYLEATPLTAFVTMSLARTPSNHPARAQVLEAGVRFLTTSARADGSWPIDTDLAVWVTTLAVNALAAGDALPDDPQLAEWIAARQYTTRHPYTGANPGGWGWTDFSGSVPDADDTPGALLALRNLGRATNEAGTKWLLGLQNRDGGWPTFCRGWGTLPFDRSGADLTAHALRALGKSHPKAVERGFRYLSRTQRPDGSWLPLWFGNQHAPDDINPVYGTARVLAAYTDHGRPAPAAIAFLQAMQNDDGGWGGIHGAPSSVEETSLAVEALARAGIEVDRGVRWLVERIESGDWETPTPIGFYFAKLWYFEELYPIIFAVGALGAALRVRK